MGDPYPEERAQQLLDELVGTTRASLAQIETAAKGWWDAGEALNEIAEQLSGASTPSSNRKAAWIGGASDAATAAFDQLAAEFARHGEALHEISRTLSAGQEDLKAISEIVQTQIGTKLKSKPKGGLFGTGIGPSVGPDVVEFVDDVGDGIGAVAHNAMSIVNKGALLSPLAALAVAGDRAEHQDMSRSDQFKLIEETHNLFSTQMSDRGETVEGTCTNNGLGPGDYAGFSGTAKTFGGTDASGESEAGPSLSSGSGLRGSSGGDPRLGPFAHHGQSHPAIGDTMPSLNERITADGSVRGFQSTPGGVDLNPDRIDPYGPGGPGGPGTGPGAGGSGGGGAAAGAGASAAGIGGGLAGALGGAKAAGAGLGAGAPGMLGGSSSAAGKSGGMGMMGQGTGGGAGAGGGGKDRGKRYGDGPELGPRRRRGAKHAVMGAGSRGDGQGEDASGPDADDPFYDE